MLVTFTITAFAPFAVANESSAEPHWAFEPLAVAEAPPSSDRWSTNAIDAFVLARLKERGLTPSSDADPTTLLRRLYLDVLGLPPTIAEIDAFARDKSPGAWTAQVDRVLASPHFGERWARHWLDVVRFAETNGFETNRERPTAFWYRDYVIASLNADKPYNEFVHEQLAGDVTGAELGTGFLAAGPYDIVKSPDISLTLTQRQDELADVVNTTATTFLALTVGCARCHDHKFDPISQQDYYSMQAVFAGFQQGEREIARKPEPRDSERRAFLERTTRRLQSELAALRARGEQRLLVSEQERDNLRVPVSPVFNEERFPPTPARFVRFVIHATTGGEPCLDELAIFDVDGNNVALAARGSVATASGTLPGHEIHRLEHVNDGRTGNARSWISSTPGTGWVQIDLQSAHRIEQVVWSRDRQRQFTDRLATDYEIQVATTAGDWQTVADGKDRRPYGGRTAEEIFAALDAPDRHRVAAIQAELPPLERELESLSQNSIMAWVGNFEPPGPTKLLYRGDPLAPRETVPPAVLSALGGTPMPLDTPEHERRTALAEWLTGPARPLAARVIVNRIWQYHFGTGIVDTPSDFGQNGTRPSHPRLLDWLAAELVRNDWSLKHIHRLILTSNTYRQASTPRDTALAVDSDSRLLWRFPPRRLSAEAIRDAILATSGVLDRQIGGPGFSAFEVDLENVRHYFPKKVWGPAEWRRMIYMTKVRQEQDAVFGIFDCPDGNQTTPRRSRSTTPLQALNLLNSPFVIQQAEVAAARIRGEAGTAPPQQAAFAYQMFYGREAANDELADAVSLIDTQGLAALCRALFNTNEFLFLF